MQQVGAWEPPGADLLHEELGGHATVGRIQPSLLARPNLTSAPLGQQRHPHATDKHKMRHTTTHEAATAGNSRKEPATDNTAESAPTNDSSHDRNETRASTSTPSPLQQLIAGILAHLLCYGAALSAVVYALVRTWGNPAAGPRVLPWMGLAYWLAACLLVWAMWHFRMQTLASLLAATLGMLLLVSQHIARTWRFPGTSIHLHILVQALSVSSVPVAIAWLGGTGSRRRAVLAHVTAILILVGGAVVYFTIPTYESVARFTFRF
ncbi:MAG: hypothetical protein E7L00_05950 [Propionibacteriaceae bacterium]|nr:hypothetical protein [Propionibacteriaceae bacterium]